MIESDAFTAALATERAGIRAEAEAARARAAVWTPAPCPPPAGWVERTPSLDEIDTPHTRRWIRT